MPSIARSHIAQAFVKALIAAALSLWGIVHFQGNDLQKTIKDGSGIVLPCSVFVGVLGYEIITRHRSKRS